MEKNLNRERLQKLLGRLDQEIGASGEDAEIYVVGGALMVLAHSRTRTTSDVDCLIRKGLPAVTNAVRKIAREEGLSPYWLNQAVTMRHLPTAADPGERPVWTGKHLEVIGASPERLLAMKLGAGREEDLQDAEILLDELKLDTKQKTRRVFEDTYPGAGWPEKTEEFLMERERRKQTPANPIPARPPRAAAARPAPPAGRQR